MKKLLIASIIAMTSASMAVAQDAKSTTDAELLGSDWQKVADIKSDTVFVRSKDITTAAEKGAWVRRIHKNGEEDTIEHYKPMSCDGINPVWRDVKITVSDTDGTLSWKKKDKNMNEPMATVLRENIFCPALKKQEEPKPVSTASGAPAGDFTTVAYRENGAALTLDTCAGIKTLTTYERVAGREGGYTYIAACQTSTTKAAWLAAKRELFQLTSKGKKTFETVYRVGNDCSLINQGDRTKKWVCNEIKTVEYADIKTIEPLTDENKDNFFQAIWVSKTPKE